MSSPSNAFDPADTRSTISDDLMRKVALEACLVGRTAAGDRWTFTQTGLRAFVNAMVYAGRNHYTGLHPTDPRYWHAEVLHAAAVARLAGFDGSPAPTGEVRVAADGASLSEERIDRIAGDVVRRMPDGLGGFMKTWGWQQFARAVLAATPSDSLEEWLPIATAPTSEFEPFLVLVPDPASSTTNDRLVLQVSRFEGYLYPDHLGSSIDFNDRIENATHWRPIGVLP